MLGIPSLQFGSAERKLLHTHYMHTVLLLTFRFFFFSLSCIFIHICVLPLQISSFKCYHYNWYNGFCSFHFRLQPCMRGVFPVLQGFSLGTLVSSSSPKRCTIGFMSVYVCDFALSWVPRPECLPLCYMQGHNSIVQTHACTVLTQSVPQSYSRLSINVLLITSKALIRSAPAYLADLLKL